MLAPGTVLQDRYRVIGKLGEGGMGAVYEALDQRLDATVALKETLFADEKLRRQFEREARLLARLHHPALPRVSDHFTEGGGEFLVMQYIPGDDLAGIITQRRGPFPQEQVALWADQLLDALDYLHTQDPQIIHRDIKPQNLKLTGRGQIVLLDFGLAKGQVHELSRVGATASIFGYTPNYAPLEQVQGLGTDPRSDLYALAATLYHLITGTKPPDALTRAASVVNGQPDPLQLASEVNAAVHPAFSEVLRRALAQNRDQRYASAAEMRKALRANTAETIAIGDDAATVLFPAAATEVAGAKPTVPDRPTVATGETTVVRAAPAGGKRVLPWAVAGGMLLLLMVGAGAFYAFQKNKTSSLAQQPSPSPVTSVQVAQPSPTPVVEQPKAASGATPEKEKQASTTRQPKKSVNVKETGKAGNDADDEDDENNRSARSKDKPPGDHPEAPEPPGSGSNLPPPTGPQRVRQIRTQTLPNGAKVMIMPNGTRVVTYPDGSTRVFPPPGQRQRRRP